MPYQYANVTEEMKTRLETRTFNQQQAYRPTSLVEENIYQNCTNQRCTREVSYRAANMNHYGTVVRVGGGCSDFYQSLPRQNRNGRPQSPPPLEVSKNFHQTMVYIPYNHIDGYQSPNPYYTVRGVGQGTDPCYATVTNQNQINKRFLEPIYHNQRGAQQSLQQGIHQQGVQSGMQHQQGVHSQGGHPQGIHSQGVHPLGAISQGLQHTQGHEEHLYSSTQMLAKPRLAYPNPGNYDGSVRMSSRSESPLPGQFSTARSTQTPGATMATCNYYPNTRYRPMVGPIGVHNGVVWQGQGDYVTKMNRHSFPAAGPRYPAADNISLTDSESQHSVQMVNGYRGTEVYGGQKDSMPNSPTKPRFIERGVPEGAASVSPQDSNIMAQSTSTMTSPTSPVNPPPTNPKPLFYAMNV